MRQFYSFYVDRFGCLEVIDATLFTFFDDMWLTGNNIEGEHAG